MSYVRYNIGILVSFIFCIMGAHLIVNFYYSSFMNDYGYNFGNFFDGGIINLMLFFAVGFFTYLVYRCYNLKGYSLYLITALAVLAPLTYFMMSPLSKENRVYQVALTNYGQIFQSVLQADVDKMHRHPEYIAYQYQLKNFQIDKESRAAYVAHVNDEMTKYKVYKGIKGSENSAMFDYFVTGQDFNNFLFRYKGLSDPDLQNELYEITKSGVVTYNDKMDFQTKFINRYKNNPEGK